MPCSETLAPLQTAVEIRLGSSQLLLLPEKAAWAPSTEELFLSDLHLGKAQAFRSHGLPIPEGSVSADLERLNRLFNQLRPKQCWVLGDLFHSNHGQSKSLAQQLTLWRQKHPEIRLTLLTGNHDQKVRHWPSEWNLRRELEATAACGLHLRHHPRNPPGDHPTLVGHLHPGIRLRSGTRFLPLRPAFILEDQQLILPAFGSLTGCCRIHKSENTRYFVLAENRVREIPAQLL